MEYAVDLDVLSITRRALQPRQRRLAAEYVTDFVSSMQPQNTVLSNLQLVSSLCFYDFHWYNLILFILF